MRQSKHRLDVVLVQKGLFESREKAKSQIMAGNVIVDGTMVDKPGTQVVPTCNVVIKKKASAYVSRGGLKLEKALHEFDISPQGKVAIDAGASTGGFTDCLLQNGAQKVFAVDVGYGQLDYKLRTDERVVVLERTNVRYIKLEDIGELADVITADLSFISLSKVFDAIFKLLKEEGDFITLIKPQFEAGRKDVGKKGVIKDPKIHFNTINKVILEAEEYGFYVWNLTYSPITGPKGNIEYLARFKKQTPFAAVIDVEQVVREAHRELIS